MGKKKLLAILFLMVVMLSMSFSSLFVNAQSLVGQDPDEYFLQSIEELTQESQSTVFVKSNLYNQLLINNGYEYVFENESGYGYALMIRYYTENNEVIYDIMEIFFDSVSPFATATGEKVYISLFTYIEYKDNNFYDITNNFQLDTDTMQLIALNGFHYKGSGDRTSIYEAISYNYKYDSSFDIVYGLPSYNFSDYPNSCANITGGILLGYYDNRFQDLIPNFEALLYINNRWSYRLQTSEVTAVINDLHFRMLTNVYGGTSVTNFKNGLTQYVNGKGRNISYTSSMSGSSFDFVKYQSQVHSGLPVVLFLSKYNIVEMLHYNLQDVVVTEYINVNHSMVAGGYREINYHRNEVVSVWSPIWYNPFRFVDEIRDVNFRNDLYLKVSTAMNGLPSGYARLNDNFNIADAYAVNIY